MAKFFVSYAHTDKSKVKKIVDLLQASKHDVWWDIKITPIADWWATILDKIEWCDVFIFVTSQQSVQSIYCRAELQYANKRQRPILLLTLDDPTTYTLPPEFPDNIQWLEYISNSAQMLSKINGAYDAINWKIHEDINAVRPPVPGDKDHIQQYQDARQFADQKQFNKANRLFRKLRGQALEEWGTECQEWLARLASYEPIIALVDGNYTKDHARNAWHKHVREFGKDFDPHDIEGKLSEISERLADSEFAIDSFTPSQQTGTSYNLTLIAAIVVAIVIGGGVLLWALSNGGNGNTDALTTEEVNETAIAQAELTESIPSNMPTPPSSANPTCTIEFFNVTPSSPLIQGTWIEMHGRGNCGTSRLTVNENSVSEFAGSEITERVELVEVGDYQVCYWLRGDGGWENADRQCLTYTVNYDPSLPPPETLEIEFIVATLDAEATIEQATLDAEATISVLATEDAVGTESSANQTATATLWTNTPTPNITASIEAYRTQQAETATQEWLDSWETVTAVYTPPTLTSTATITPTETNTPTQTPTITNTPTFTPTLLPEQIALISVVSNSEWTPYERIFNDVTMVLVPTGCFVMGSNDGQSDEQPITTICFEEPFWIDKYEVTNDLYGSSSLGSCAEYSFEPQQPRNCVSWVEARDFCITRGMRLPSEVEWEYAARGPDSLIYPWGNQFITDNAIHLGNSNLETAEVGSILAGASWVDAMDMAGNLWEWTNSAYLEYSFEETYRGDADASITGQGVLRSGSFFFAEESIRSANRYNEMISYVGFGVGFRCARDFDINE